MKSKDYAYTIYLARLNYLVSVRNIKSLFVNVRRQGARSRGKAQSLFLGMSIFRPSGTQYPGICE